MNMFFASKDFNSSKEIEIIERKGSGHPDTLADGLAEHLSISFSNYSLERFGAVLHHNFDKVGLLGGTSYVAFSEGYLVSPIRVLINGRMSTKFANERIPTKKLLINWTKEFFRKHLPLIDPDEDLEFHLNLSSQSSPGKTYEKDAKRSARQRWFEPESLADLPELNKLMSNDTSVGVGYAPASSLEIIGLEIENSLNSDEYKEQNPWIGSDIKVMGVRNRDKYYFTICIPQIAKHVRNLDNYVKNLSEARKHIGNILLNHKIKDENYELSINTRDNYDLAELYLTATGSSIESGDEGLAGRGNRVNKIISPTRPMSMEGSCGKNPVYHIGKIYYVAAFNLANKIYEKLGIENEVYIISQSGRDLLDPWIIAVYTQNSLSFENELHQIINDEIKNLPEITNSILKGEIRIY